MAIFLDRLHSIFIVDPTSSAYEVEDVPNIYEKRE